MDDDFGEAMLDAVLPAAHLEHVRHLSRSGSVRMAWREAGLDAVVRQDGMNLVGHSGDQSDKEGGDRHAVGALYQMNEGEFAGAVDGQEEIEFALRRSHFGDVDVKEAYRIGVELPIRRLSPSTSGRPGSWRCRQRCRLDRVRCGIVAFKE